MNSMSEVSTGERAVSAMRGEIGKEAQRIEESAQTSAKGHFKAAEIWGVAHVVLGLLIVILAAIAGAKAFSKIDADGTIAGVLSIAVAVLSSVATFLNPSKMKTDHLSSGNKYEALVNRVRIFRTIECWGDSSDQALSARLMKLSEEKAVLNLASPQIPFIAYWLGKRGISRGEASYKVDDSPKGTPAA